MFTIAGQNVHQATPAVLAVMKAEGVKLGDDFVLPVPVTTILFRPWQRVSLWPQLGLNPFRLFLEGLAALAPFEITGLPDFGNERPYAGGLVSEQLQTIVSELRASPRSSVLLPSPRLGGPVQHAHLVVNVEGDLDLLVATIDGDLVGDVLGRIPVAYSFVQELVAEALGVMPGVLYHVSTAARLSGSQEALLGLAEEDVVPCPYLTDDGEALPWGAHAPILGLPLGRWRRELSTLLRRGPEGPPGEDPWLEGVARPLWSSWRAFSAPVVDPSRSAQGALTGLPALDWAQAGWEWLGRQEAAS